MVSPLSFRCTSCGNCCRGLRVAVTALDVIRLVQVCGRSADELVAWLAPDAVDMTGEPESFVELSEGRRLMVLDHDHGACRLLGSDNRCRAYGGRPRDCRAYPFDFEPHPSTGSAPRRLTLLPFDGCEYETDGRNDAAALEAEDTERWRELRNYQALVAGWNRRAFHRRRLHKSAGSAQAFLAFAFSLTGSRVDVRDPVQSESAERETLP